MCSSWELAHAGTHYYCYSSSFHLPWCTISGVQQRGWTPPSSMGHLWSHTSCCNCLCLAVLHQPLMILAVLQLTSILLTAPFHHKGLGRVGGGAALACGLFAAEIIITRLVNVSKCLFAQLPLSTSPSSAADGSGSPAGCILLLTAPLHLKGTEQLVLLQFVVWPVRSWKIITQSTPTPFILASGSHLSALKFSYYYYYYYCCYYYGISACRWILAAPPPATATHVKSSSGSDRPSSMPSLEVTWRPRVVCCHSCPSPLSPTLAPPMSTSRCTVMMTNGCLCLRDPRTVVIILFGMSAHFWWWGSRIMWRAVDG